MRGKRLDPGSAEFSISNYNELWKNTIDASMLDNVEVPPEWKPFITQEWMTLLGGAPVRAWFEWKKRKKIESDARWKKQQESEDW